MHSNCHMHQQAWVFRCIRNAPKAVQWKSPNVKTHNFSCKRFVRPQGLAQPFQETPKPNLNVFLLQQEPSGQVASDPPAQAPRSDRMKTRAKMQHSKDGISDSFYNATHELDTTEYFRDFGYRSMARVSGYSESGLSIDSLSLRLHSSAF